MLSLVLSPRNDCKEGAIMEIVEGMMAHMRLLAAEKKGESGWRIWPVLG